MRSGRMRGGPDVRLTSFDGEFALAQKFVADHEAGLFPFRDAGFRDEFVSVFGRDEKTRVRFDQRNADYAMRFEKFVERKSGCSEESRCALIEPAEVVREENNVGGITIAELNSDSNTVYEHKLFALQDAAGCASNPTSYHPRNDRRFYRTSVQFRKANPASRLQRA